MSVNEITTFLKTTFRMTTYKMFCYLTAVLGVQMYIDVQMEPTDYVNIGTQMNVASKIFQP